MKAEATDGPDLWSERRLAYVAITRAEDRCVVLDIPHPKFGIRSQFLSEACLPQEQSLTEADKGEMAKTASAWDDLTLDFITAGEPGDDELETAWGM